VNLSIIEEEVGEAREVGLGVPARFSRCPGRQRYRPNARSDESFVIATPRVGAEVGFSTVISMINSDVIRGLVPVSPSVDSLVLAPLRGVVNYAGTSPSPLIGPQICSVVNNVWDTLTTTQADDK
jgi:hypothetical protein